MPFIRSVLSLSVVVVVVVPDSARNAGDTRRRFSVTPVKKKKNKLTTAQKFLRPQLFSVVPQE